MNNTTPVIRNASADASYTGIGGSLRTRGCDVAVRSMLEEQERRDMMARLENPVAYRYSEIMESVTGAEYRSGTVNGRSFMTVNDLRRLLADQGRTPVAGNGCLADIDDILRATEEQRRMPGAYNRSTTACISAEARPAHAYGIASGYRDGSESAKAAKNITGESVVYRGGRSETMRVEGTAKGLKRYGRSVGGSYAVSKRQKVNGRTSESVVALLLVVVFALVLALPISLSVVINKESAGLAAMDSELRKAESEAESLQIELDKKNDLFTLENLAVNEYGMISLDSSAYRVLKINAQDRIENFGDEGKDGGAVLALLSALGLRKAD